MEIYKPGSVIDGRYEVVSKPQMGGMGIVYFCVDRQENLPVALKTFRPEFLPDRPARNRFLKESSVWLELGNHPNIVHCHRVVSSEVGLESFIALELISAVEGNNDASLRSWLIPGRPVPVNLALAFAVQITRGMKYASEKIPGIVHRDLKPENILVGADRLSNWSMNRLRITDFGLAGFSNILSDSIDHDTLVDQRKDQTRSAVGTPLYMAPEQWKKGTLGMYTDIYALGLILIEMLTGNHPVEGRTLGDLYKAHCAGNIRKLPANFSASVQNIVTKCTVVEAGARYQDWQSLENALIASSTEVIPALPKQEMTASLDNNRSNGWSYISLGNSYIQIGKYETACENFAKALSIGQVLNDDSLEFSALLHTGIVHGEIGDLDATINYLNQALNKASLTNDPSNEAAALLNLGLAYRKIAKTQLAIDHFNRALEIVQQVGNPRGEGKILNNLGGIYAQKGELKLAINYLEESRKIALEIGDRRGEAAVLNKLGIAYDKLGDHQQALHFFEQQLTIAQEIGDPNMEATASFNVAKLYVQQEQPAKAIHLLQKAQELYQEIGDEERVQDAKDMLALLQLLDTPSQDNIQLLNLSDEKQATRSGTAQKIEIELKDSNTFFTLGKMAADKGDMVQAIKYYEQSLAINREIEDQQGEGAALGNLGKAYREIGDLQKGLAYSKEALSIFQEIGDRKSEGEELSLQGTAYAQLKDMNNAIKCWETALQIASDVGDKLLEGNCNYNLALTFFNLGKHEQVLKFAERALTLYQEVGRPDWANDVRTLITKVKGDSSSTQISPVRAALAALVYADSPQSLESITKQFPFMLKDEFIKLVEMFIAEQISPEDKHNFEKRVAFLRYLASQK